MKSTFQLVWAAAICAAATLAADKPMRLKDMPLVVQKTIRNETKGAKITGTLTEVEDGKTLYEVETLVNGHTRDFLVNEQGAVVEVEEGVSVDSVPGPVKAALEKAASGGKLTKLERVKRGEIVTYEASVLKNGKKTGMELRADGSRIK